MPRGDQTGPAGMGPMTGRAAGYCAGFGAPGFVSGVGGQGYGRGVGWGRGGGRGWRNRFYATGTAGWGRVEAPAFAYPRLDPAAERQALQAQAAVLQSDLDRIHERLAAFAEDAKGAR